jgi:hypothetical protein
MDPASEIRPTLDDVVNKFGLIRFAAQFRPSTTAGTLDSIRAEVMLHQIWSSQPTCKSCNSLTIFMDKDLFFQPINPFVLTADRGCKFCALLLRGIVLCVPESKRDAVFDLSFRRASFKISYSQPKNKRKFFLDYFINKGTHSFLNWDAFSNAKRRLDDPSSDLGIRFLPRQITPGNTASSQTVEFVQQLLRRCITAHVACRSPESDLPTRVLDLRQYQEDNIKLRHGQGDRARYACLSHCWGTKRTITTTTENLPSRMSRIPWGDLPKTFQDAIIFARSLDIDFIWIDSLCIVQDDEIDWARESAEMSSIYQNSFITIAATKSEDHDGGCFSEMAAKYQAQEVAALESTNQHVQVYSRLRLPHPDWSGNQGSEFPLLTRGWVYQERLLSPRVLHFLRNEIMWECKELTACECHQETTAERENSKHMHTQDMEKINRHLKAKKGGRKITVNDGEDLKSLLSSRWEEIVHQYSNLNLTFHKDKLPALSGLARQMQEFRDDQYLAGLWHNDLDQGLVWYVDDNEGDDLLPPRPLGPIAPTWSWASISHGVSARWTRWSGDQKEAKILEAEVCLASSDPYGEVKSGFVVLCSVLAPGRIHYYEEINRQLFRTSSRYELIVPGVEVAGFLPDYELSEPSPYQILNDDEVFCLWMRKGWHTQSDYAGLVLRLVQEPNVYQRIGIADINQLDKSKPAPKKPSGEPWEDAVVKII